MDTDVLTLTGQGEDYNEETIEIPYYQQETDIFAEYNLCEIKCGDNYVSTEIGDAYKNWCPVIPVFISAQTGQGKNYFVENVLIPHVMEKSKIENKPYKILILSNRIALNLQGKIRIMDNLGCQSEREELSDKGILNRTEIRHVTILQYQGLLGAINHLKPQEYAYVVCDECHFFTSDAMFNPYTGAILEAITRSFSNAVRVYMTATFGDCIKYICQREKEILSGYIDEERARDLLLSGTDGRAMFYTFNRDYSYLDIHYFYDHSALIPVIKGSSGKWLIFIDDKQKCKDLGREISACLIAESQATNEEEANNPKNKKEKSVKLIDSGSKEDEEYLDILKREKFEEKVLVSTSVIDNGVNLRDEKLTNVVISDINKAKCLQMLGRIRVNKDSKIRLYLKEFDARYMEKRIKDLERQRDAYHLYNNAYTLNHKDMLQCRRYFNQKYYNGRTSDFEDAKHWFYRENSSLELVKFNDIANDLSGELLNTYRSILAEMTDTGDGKRYLEYQLSWFNQIYDEKSDITKQGVIREQTEFINFIIGYIGKTIPKTEKDTFRQSFTEKYVSGYGRRKIEDGFSANDHPSRKLKYEADKINEIFAVRTREIGRRLHIELQKDGWLITDKTDSVADNN